MKLIRFKFPAGLLLPGLLLMLVTSSCNYPTQRKPTSTPDILPTLVATLLATPVPGTTEATPETPARLLTVCVKDEPRSLFPYEDQSYEAKAVRTALYDGPVDFVNFSAQPVILEKVPSLTDGDVLLEPVQVSSGEAMVDALGNLTSLQEGSLYFPSGCREQSCAVTYSQASSTAPVLMDQLIVRYQLKEGLLWSDGAPLTASDSVYASEVARQLFPKVLPDLLQLTNSYRTLDERTVEWRGTPGYIDPDYADNFFLPLPEHVWGELPANELASAEVSSKLPIGWGPYKLEEWVAGDHITLVKNDRYFRAEDGLPAFDNLVYRFVGDTQEGLTAVLAGECDVLDVSALDGADPTELVELSNSAKIQLVRQPDTAWEQLLFGIQPADIAQPAYFGLKETRKAIWQCIDRQALASRLGLASDQLMDAYLPASHPLYNAEVEKPPFDPQAAAAALQAAGWLDSDSNPATPRVSQGVAGVPDGTSFTVDLATLQDEERQAAAQVVIDSLAECGIQVNLRPLPQEELFAPGPEGPIFGRRFHLALFGWDLSLQPACQLFMTNEIPGPYPDNPKGWGGANSSGFTNAEFDAACLKARASLPDDPGHAAAHRDAQEIFTDESPAVPLYSHSRFVVTRPDLCGLHLDGSTQDVLWNLEGLNYGDTCPDN